MKKAIFSVILLVLVVVFDGCSSDVGDGVRGGLGTRGTTETPRPALKGNPNAIGQVLGLVTPDPNLEKFLVKLNSEFSKDKLCAALTISPQGTLVVAFDSVACGKNGPTKISMKLDAEVTSKAEFSKAAEGEKNVRIHSRTYKLYFSKVEVGSLKQLTHVLYTDNEMKVVSTEYRLIELCSLEQYQCLPVFNKQHFLYAIE